MTAGEAYEVVDGGGRTGLLLICDHATNRVPAELDSGLGLPAEEMGRHIAYDIGARGVTLELARLLDAPAVLTRFSRLVIDPNRGEDDPTLLMRLYDGTIIPGNRDLRPGERERRLEAYHRPYHRAIEARLDAMAADRRDPGADLDPFLHAAAPRAGRRGPGRWASSGTTTGGSRCR